ncbi:YggT family protein [Alginatibacterium sediminis]|uniref:YggT family protein n=1 Tax=Alginatibacterium sediminis TaxID=2164068 RepID=A0A420E8K4_9ALTE|nr:YggT family protein [Alginatibacterium sediminis]RKF15668.1 YggT family protein [Alginatibacterium sediminis]
MQAFQYLINIVFDLYLMIVLLRIWLQLVRADFYNPFSQFVIKATNPVVAPLRRIIPGLGGVDWASVLIAFAVAALKWALLMGMTGAISWQFLPYIAALNVVKEAGTMIFWVLLLRAILSWVSQGRSPVEYVMSQLSEPLLSPIRRVIPAIGGLDLSVLVLFIILNFLNLLMAGWIPYWSAI